MARTKAGALAAPFQGRWRVVEMDGWDEVSTRRSTLGTRMGRTRNRRTSRRPLLLPQRLRLRFHLRTLVRSSTTCFLDMAHAGSLGNPAEALAAPNGRFGLVKHPPAIPSCQPELGTLHCVPSSNRYLEVDYCSRRKAALVYKLWYRALNPSVDDLNLVVLACRQRPTPIVRKAGTL